MMDFVGPKNTPLMEIPDEETLSELGKQWQDILGISDWIVKYVLVDMDGSILEGKYMGLCDFDSVNKVAIIYLAKYGTIPKNSPMTICMENTLVHELMHVVNPIFITKNATYEEEYVYNEEHSKMEKMARALIKAKYGLTDNFYVNSEYIEKVGE